MNLIPPIATAPVGTLPGNGLEPGENPLAGVEGPIFYDELVAALSKGAGGDGGTVSTDSSGDSALADGENPQGDLQGLPAELTIQLVDQAIFSPVAIQPVALSDGTYLPSSDPALSAGLSVIPAISMTGLEAVGADVAVGSERLVAQRAGAARDANGINLASEVSLSKVAVAEIESSETSGAQSGTRGSAVSKTFGELSVENVSETAAGQDPALTLRAARVDQKPLPAAPNVISADSEIAISSSVAAAQLNVSSSSRALPTEGALRDLNAELGNALTPTIVLGRSVVLPAGPSLQAAAEGDAVEPVVGSMDDMEPTMPSQGASRGVLGDIETPAVESKLGRPPAVALSTGERGPSTGLIRTEAWQGLIPSPTAVKRPISPLDDITAVNSSDLSPDVSLVSSGAQTAAAAEGFGDWRFTVRPNSTNPVDGEVSPEEVSPQSDQISAPLVKAISDPSSSDFRMRVMTVESGLSVDQHVHIRDRDAAADPAVSGSSRIIPDRRVDEITSQSTANEGRSTLNGAMSAVADVNTDAEAESGPSISIAEKFVSTLLGISGLQPENAADRTATQFRQPRTIVSAPHMARWDAAAVQVELVRLVRDGGGQIVMRLTPPDEGAFRIDLSLDPDRGVRIFVEGASDSVKTRLEQGAEQLREQFSQMGFNLQLDMQNRREAFAQSAGFGFGDTGDPSDMTGAGSFAAESRTAIEVPAPPHRRSIIDESLVYFRA